MENQQQSAPVAVAAKSYTPPTSAPAPVAASAPAAAATATPTPPRTASPAAISTPATPAPAEPEPVAATILEKSNPAATSASNGSSSNEVASLRKENEKLKGEVAERDTIIRELELKLERVRVSGLRSVFERRVGSLTILSSRRHSPRTFRAPKTHSRLSIFPSTRTPVVYYGLESIDVDWLACSGR